MGLTSVMGIYCLDLFYVHSVHVIICCAVSFIQLLREKSLLFYVFSQGPPLEEEEMLKK